MDFGDICLERAKPHQNPLLSASSSYSLVHIAHSCQTQKWRQHLQSPSKSFMQFILRSIFSPGREPKHQHQTRRAFVDATIKWVRDRGLDHAVEKEKNLRPVINLKNLIKSEPSKSLPFSIIADKKDYLGIPIRVVDFVRRYRSVFEEFLPGGIGVHPRIRLTPQVLELDSEEQLIYQSETYQQQAADRLLKLLMMCRINKVPLNIVDLFKWDLGLPHDYVQSLVPQFPDYFQVKRSKDSSSGCGIDVLELVCWSSELAVTVMEKKAMNGKLDYEKGMPIAFPVQYSRGFEMDKKVKKWVDEWQKLPYISPYENALHLPPKSDESDKWAVAILHELLHILIPKKTDKENILCLGEYMGLRSRFKRALLHHPGIFYLSSKNRTHTVILREAYKRDLLIEKHPMMIMRYRYVHLMNTAKDEHKGTTVPSCTTQQQQTANGSEEGKGEEVDYGSEEEWDGALNGLSSSEEEDACDDIDDEDDDGYEGKDEDESKRGRHRNVVINRGRTRKRNLKAEGPLGHHGQERSQGKYHRKTKDKAPSNASRRIELCDSHNSSKRLPKRSDFSQKQRVFVAR
ncbi:protein WHAT'S THIS FACTOR 9, mitochondrial [Malania oleifera]|uniref:protein WHAT'S THIS FACTOR 9, mitochondrial n=1 Tax=Malania oleifera TaxID=397392 RepID=UPI0025AE7C9A|nr:protein WHAT'S THIS FACTOR 9, mitochondrial [Malania oleifera]XP_057973319.1 protein WHAT'S THIS FACTOR 9, mitochondrial [Malania oleifera]